MSKLLNKLTNLILGIFLMGSVAYGAAPNQSHSSKVKTFSTADSVKIKRFYQDGDFEQAISILEEKLRDKLIQSHTDSVFVFKHLGVMYAANEKTRERGKYYMLQLIMIEPTAKIMDMYASDMIYMVFKNIKEEYDLTHTQNQKFEQSSTASAPVETKSQPEPKISHTSTYLWIGVGVVVVSVGVATYLFMNSQSTPPNQYEVP